MVHTMMPGTEELLEKEEMVTTPGYWPYSWLVAYQRRHDAGVMMYVISSVAATNAGSQLRRCNRYDWRILQVSHRNVTCWMKHCATIRCIKKQLGKFLDFESDAPNRAELVNNFPESWMERLLFHGLPQAGKHIIVNYMIGKGIGSETSERRKHQTVFHSLVAVPAVTRILISPSVLKQKLCSFSWIGSTSGNIYRND